MTKETIQEAESVTRSIARWGSMAAAIIFGVAFVTDPSLSWHVISGQAVQILLMCAVFVGYALAWTKRFEVIGSVIVLLAMAGAYLVPLLTTNVWPNPFFFAVGAPAVLHLVAVVLHRFVVAGKTESSA